MEAKEVKKIMPSGHRYIDLTARDVSACSKNFRELKPEVKDFVFPPNYVQRDRVLSLSGTIPVSVRGNSYNIPICIYIRKDHPYCPPYCYVTPTAGMSLAPSRYMDTKGMVYLPYLNEWKQDKSHLSDLVQILVVTFGEQCPVYSTPPGGAAAQQPRPQWNQPAAGYPQQQPRSPYPVAGGYPTPQPPYGGGYPTSQPSPAPYPSSNHPGSYAMPTTTPSQYPPQGQYPTPYPMPPASTAAYPSGSSPAAQFPTPYGTQQYQPTTSTFTPAVATAATTAAVQTVASSAEKERQDESIKRESLTTEVQHKVKQQLSQVLGDAQREMDSLLDTQAKLGQRNTELTSMLSQIKDKKVEADEAIEDLQLKNAELASVVEQLKREPEEFNIDDSVQGTNVVFNQILNLYAEENAIDDAMYFLGEALRREAITLEVFLKNVRELSRRQFIVKATIEKARLTAGLSNTSGRK